jgi:hypothetical protein
MHNVHRRLLLAVLMACGAFFVPRSPAATDEIGAVEAAARVFMAGYGEELLAMNREAIIARYHTDGALMITGSGNRFVPAAQLAERYRRPTWKGLGAFAWQDLRYRAVSRDTVFVEGAFQSGAGAQPKTTTYFAILTLEAGQLKIRAEVEFGKVPAASAAQPGAAAPRR